MTDHRLPTNAYWGPLGRYVELMTPTTEAPPEFHFACIVAVASVLFARVGLALGPTTIYPTQYCILAGSTGVTRKTTSANAALKILERVDPGLHVMYGLGSREGIMTQLKDHPLALWRTPEFTSLLVKAESKATSTLTELLLQLPDRPSVISSHTLSNPIKVEGPAVTILGDSTVEYLSETFAKSSLTNGLINRLSIFIGHRGEPLPFPPPPNKQHLNGLVKDLKTARQALNNQKAELTPEALERWDHVYRNDVYPLQEKPGGEVFARVGDRILQFAMLYAFSDQRHVIESDDIDAGLIVTRYLTGCTRQIADAIGQSDYSAVLDRIVEIVAQKTPIGGSKPGDITRGLSAHQRSIANDRGGIAQLLKNLDANERIHRLEDGCFINTELETS